MAFEVARVLDEVGRLDRLGHGIDRHLQSIDVVAGDDLAFGVGPAHALERRAALVAGLRARRGAHPAQRVFEQEPVLLAAGDAELGGRRLLARAWRAGRWYRLLEVQAPRPETAASMVALTVRTRARCRTRTGSPSSWADRRLPTVQTKPARFLRLCVSARCHRSLSVADESRERAGAGAGARAALAAHTGPAGRRRRPWRMR